MPLFLSVARTTFTAAVAGPRVERTPGPRRLSTSRRRRFPGWTVRPAHGRRLQRRSRRAEAAGSAFRLRGDGVRLDDALLGTMTPRSSTTSSRPLRTWAKVFTRTWCWPGTIFGYASGIDATLAWLKGEPTTADGTSVDAPEISL